tara:strand:+ start:121 stop:741 length:621 start_codon:yes stop_codon:yes gene_type:complete
MTYILKFEEWLKKVSTLKVFNSSQISRWEFLGSILLIWSIPIFDCLFMEKILPSPWSSEAPMSRLVKFILTFLTLFGIVLLQPIFILKRLRRVYGKIFHIKEFYLFSLRSIKVPRVSITVERAVFIIFCFQVFCLFLLLMKVPTLGSSIFISYIWIMEVSFRFWLEGLYSQGLMGLNYVLFAFVALLIWFFKIFLIFCKDNKTDSD